MISRLQLEGAVNGHSTSKLTGNLDFFSPLGLDYKPSKQWSLYQSSQNSSLRDAFHSESFMAKAALLLLPNAM